METELFSPLLIGVSYVCLVYCPLNSGFTHDSGSNTCFQLAIQTADWSSASGVCHSLHSRAHLVVIGDQPKQTTVTNYLQGEDRTS